MQYIFVNVYLKSACSTLVCKWAREREREVPGACKVDTFIFLKKKKNVETIYNFGTMVLFSNKPI